MWLQWWWLDWLRGLLATERRRLRDFGDDGGANIGNKEGGSNGVVAVAIDKDESSKHALKWALDNLLSRGQSVILIHVKVRPSLGSLHASSTKVSQDSSLVCRDPEGVSKEIFLPFRYICSRKEIHCQDMLLEGSDVAKALVEYVNQAAVDILVVGSSKGGFLRFNKPTDIPRTVTKTAPDFCTVYVISKGKISTMRSASRTAPLRSPVQPPSLKPPQLVPSTSTNNIRADRRSFESQQRMSDDDQQRRSMEDQQRRSMDDQSESFRLSNFSDMDSGVWFESSNYGRRSRNISNSPTEFSSGLFKSERSPASQSIDDVEAEMRRLRLELKQTMEMYNKACKEALTAKQKATERQLEEARLAEEAAL